MNTATTRTTRLLRPGIVAVPVGARRWAAVIDHDELATRAHRLPGSVGHRSGYWCDDDAGGWGTGRTAEQAVRACGRPTTYPTICALLAEHDV